MADPKMSSWLRGGRRREGRGEIGVAAAGRRLGECLDLRGVCRGWPACPSAGTACVAPYKVAKPLIMAMTSSLLRCRARSLPAGRGSNPDGAAR